MKMKQVLQALQHGTSEGAHKRLLAEALDPYKWKQISSSSFYADDMEEFRKLGEQLLQKPIQVIPYSLYKQFDTTGERNAYQQIYFEHRRRLDVFAVLALADNDPRYIPALEDVIWAICDEYTWCLPAHLGGNSLSIIEELNGSSVEGLSLLAALHPEHQATLDLFSTETAFYLSEITYLLQDRLSALVVYRARKEVKERVLASYASLSRSSNWETSEMNWAAVCAGSIGAAAMYLIEDDHMLAPLLHRVLESMESFLDGFSEDGACLEGVIYWNYGFGFYTAFAELLKERTAGRIDLMQSHQVKQIACFQQKSYLNLNFVISYSDCPLTSNYIPGLTHRLKKNYDEVEIPEAQFRAGILGDNCFRWVYVIRNLVWTDPSLAGEALQDRAYYLDGAEIMISRASIERKTGTKRIAFSAKGGHNDEPHNHNDLGSFIVHVGAQSLFVDPGAGHYTKAYFGVQRYSLIYNGSHGHSVPIVEGQGQQAGANYKAVVLSTSLSKERDELTLDISKAYNNPNLTGLLRHFQFDKVRGRLVLEDQYTFIKQPASITERLVTFVKPEQLAPGIVSIQGASEHAVLRFDFEQLSCEIHSEDFILDDPSREFLYCIDLHVRQPEEHQVIKLEIEIQ